MAAVQKILLLVVAILLIPSATSKSPESSPANEKGHCNSQNDAELSSGSQPQSCSTQVDSVDPSSQEEDQQDHAIDHKESILQTMSHASQSSEDSSSTKSCSSSNSEDCEAEPGITPY